MEIIVYNVHLQLQEHALSATTPSSIMAIAALPAPTLQCMPQQMASAISVMSVASPALLEEMEDASNVHLTTITIQIFVRVLVQQELHLL